MSVSQNYPNVKPELLIDLANVKKLDPRISLSRASTGTYFDANGVLQTAPSGVARFQFDPVTGASKGLLRENQATNLVLYSEQFDNASWTKFRSVVVSNSLTAPDGTSTAYKLIQGSGETTTGGISQSITVSAGKVVLSCFAKIGEYKGVILRCVENIQVVAFNLTNGTVSENLSSLATLVVDYGNGYYRVSVEFPISSTGAKAFNIQVSDESGNQTGLPAGNGYSGIYIWGAQLE